MLLFFVEASIWCSARLLLQNITLAFWKLFSYFIAGSLTPPVVWHSPAEVPQSKLLPPVLITILSSWSLTCAWPSSFCCVFQGEGGKNSILDSFYRTTRSFLLFLHHKGKPPDVFPWPQTWPPAQICHLRQRFRITWPNKQMRTWDKDMRTDMIASIRWSGLIACQQERHNQTLVKTRTGVITRLTLFTNCSASFLTWRHM